MTDLPQPEIVKPKPFVWVWVAPLAALLIGSYLIYREFAEKGPVIEIVFEDGAGLEAGKTLLRYKGMAVGVVESVSLSEDLSYVRAFVALQKSAKGLARAGSVFWILRPEIGIEGVRGLGTILSGPSIQVAPGTGDFEKRFVGLSRAPRDGNRAGTHYFIKMDTLGSLRPGSPVLYREVRVGEVVDSTLSADAASVRARILIDPPYERLIQTDSVFWNVSGVAMKIGLLGARIQTNSLESMLVGGVMFATPETGRDRAELAAEGAVFELHSEARSEWLNWRPTISLE